MNAFKLTAVLLCAMLLGISQPRDAPIAPSGDVAALGLLPKPRHVQLHGAAFAFPSGLGIAATTQPERSAALFLARFLQTRGLSATIQPAGPAPVRLTLANGIPQIGSEGYRLAVAVDGVTIGANTAAGLFYGVQTLEQLFPADNRDNTLPAVTIVDWPEYNWRGIHLDVSRHFFSVPVVEQFIDVSAHYKLNTFHWHLTDDQGWRLPIAKYPRLTQIGACRNGTERANDPTDVDAVRYCGHYTPGEIRAVVAYAQARHVRIVPEIEMPGHNVAAITAYPWLACGPGRFQVRTTWGVSTDIACPSERTFAFEENVLSAVIKLFPGEYIHIGGDEVPKDAWQHSRAVHALMRREQLANYDAVQGFFTRRIERFLNAHGRKMIGWDEILDGGVSRHATVMSWRGTDGGTRAARRGNDVVMTPDGPLYLDWAQGDTNYEPVAIDGLSTPQMIYDFHPTPTALSAAQARHILGVQGNVWTERIPTAAHLFYMLLPRELAVAEDGWTPARDRIWSDFSVRTGKQYSWFDQHQLAYRIPNPTLHISSSGELQFENVHRSVNETEVTVSPASGTITIGDPVPSAAIYYTLDDSVPTPRSRRYTQPIAFDLGTAPALHLRAIAALAGGRASAASGLTIRR